MEKIMFTTNQVAEELKLKPTTIRGWVQKGFIKNHNENGTKLMLDMDEAKAEYNRRHPAIILEEPKEIDKNIKMKECPRCHRSFPATFDYFNVQAKAKDGVQSLCKQCNSEYLKEYKEKYPEYGKNKYKENRWKTIINTHKNQALKLGLIADFTEEEWNYCLNYFDNKCAYCGESENIQIEHIIPKSKGGGFTKTNIVCCCSKCNNQKDALDLDTFAQKFDKNVKKCYNYLVEMGKSND